MFHCWCFISNASHRSLGDKSPLVLSDCILSLSLLHWGRRPRPPCLVFPVRLLYLQTSVGKVPVWCTCLRTCERLTHKQPGGKLVPRWTGGPSPWKRGSELSTGVPAVSSSAGRILQHSGGVITKTGPLAHLVWLMSYKWLWRKTSSGVLQTLHLHNGPFLPIVCFYVKWCIFKLFNCYIINCGFEASACGHGDIKCDDLSEDKHEACVRPGYQISGVKIKGA